MDNNELAKWLEELLEFRQVELRDCEEYNSFSKHDDDLFQAKNNKLSAAINELKNSNVTEQYNDLKIEYAYLAADFENFKKRSLAKESEYYYSAKNNIIKNILPIVDDFERVIKELDKKSSDSSDNVDPIETGIRITYENLLKTLKAEGCVKIDCSYGDKFDVNKHEAIAVRKIAADEGYDADDICEIYQSGWMIADKVIRPVKVVVCQ